jgi:integrase/recombinase XerD
MLHKEGVLKNVELAGLLQAPAALREGEITIRLLEEYLAHHHSPYTRKAYAYELGNFFRTVGKVDLTLVTRRDLLAYKEYISSRYKSSTVTWKLTAVGGFLRYAHKQGAVPEDVTEGIRGPQVHQGQPEFLTVEEARALLRAPDRRKTIGKRDYALLQLLLQTGVRIGEALSLRIRDLTTRYGCPAVRIMGKGRKPRTLRVLPEVKEAVDAYLASRKGAKPEDHLFATVPRNGEVSRPLSPRVIQKSIKKYAAAALIKRNITPHTLRHTTATLELEGGATVAQIREQLGHSNISVTNRYLQSLEGAEEKNPLYNNGPWGRAL